MPLIQVSPAGDHWTVLEDGTELGIYPSQEEAEREGRARARRVGAEFQLHGADAEIREKDSYGNDPSEVPG